MKKRRFVPFCRHLEDRTPLSSLPLAPPVAHPASPGIYQVANGTLFGPAGPVYTDVAQGNLGDCWLVASFAEAAARDPQLIRNMFTYLGVYRERGVAVQLYDVRFYNKNGQVKTVLVDNKFPMMRGTEYNDQVRNGVLWVALAEKAYVEAASLGYVTNSHTQTHARVSDSYTDVVGGDPLWGLGAITGQAGGEAYNFSGDNILTNIVTFSGSNVAAEMAAGNMVVIGTGFTTTNPAIVGGHAYAVLGYNSATGLFTIFNPWNAGAVTTYDGHAVYGSVFNCSAATITQNYETNAFDV